MKIKIAVLAILVIATNCAHDENPVYITKVKQVPDSVFPVPLCPTLYGSITQLFKEGVDTRQKYPGLFSGAYAQKIVLTKDADIYVTYVGEGAGKQNTLAWYSYTTSVPPSIQVVERHLIFPHVSNTVLHPGDTRRINLGKFRAGTSIGFFLIIDGWNGAQSAVDTSKEKLFTDPSLNTNGQQQHIMFEERSCGNVVVGFEDLVVRSDNDFNDVLFIVSDNAAAQASTSFKMEYIPSL